MTFEEAITRLKNGDRIFRKSWNEKKDDEKDRVKFFCVGEIKSKYHSEITLIEKSLSGDYVSDSWCPFSVKDVFADDWEIYKEGND